MSSIIFNRLITSSDFCDENNCDTEQEVEEDDYSFHASDVDSKNFFVNLYKVILFFLPFLND